ncbi:hypothetical protein, partial [Fulvivirga lutimaris]|uniref:hypothetical protein n=1 Tax=Fulvivirga lutimaris TaxID=1819566 RepID=UPI00162A989F
LRYLAGALLVFLSHQSIAQISNDTKTSAEPLTNLNNWCSGTNVYTTVGSAGNYSTSCDGSNYNDVWFKFQASTSFLSAKATPGSLRYSSLTLFDENNNEIVCKKGSSSGSSEFVTESLIVGDWYYLSVGSS